jgi:hypothetical protein
MHESFAGQGIVFIGKTRKHQEPVYQLARSVISSQKPEHCGPELAEVVAEGGIPGQPTWWIA